MLFNYRTRALLAFLSGQAFERTASPWIGAWASGRGTSWGQTATSVEARLWAALGPPGARYSVDAAAGPSPVVLGTGVERTLACATGLGTTTRLADQRARPRRLASTKLTRPWATLGGRVTESSSA